MDFELSRPPECVSARAHPLGDVSSMFLPVPIDCGRCAGDMPALCTPKVPSMMKNTSNQVSDGSVPIQRIYDIEGTDMPIKVIFFSGRP